MALDLDTSPQGTWQEWARHVLLELTRLNANQASMGERLQEMKSEIDAKTSKLGQDIQSSLTSMRSDSNKEISDIKVELAMLRVKAGLWGAVGAAIPILITLAVGFILKHSQ
jgi:hypothetical protein